MKKMTIKNKNGLKEVLLEIALVCMVALTLVTTQSCDDKKNNSPYDDKDMHHNGTDDRMSGVNTKTEDPKDVAEEHNDAKFHKDAEKEAQFMVDAADISLTEIKLGRLAEQKGEPSRSKTWLK